MQKRSKETFFAPVLRPAYSTIFWRKVLCGAFLFLFFGRASQGQTTAAVDGYNLRTSGFFIGLGLRQPLKHTPYYPASLGLEFFKSFRRYHAMHAPRRVYAGVLGEPMMSFVRTNQTAIQWEGGATAGVRTLCRLSRRCTLYGTITSGPYFHTADVEQQAPGYLFSDNFNLGLFMQLGKSAELLLNTQLRYRHISNGDTRVPNNGINTIHLIVGVSRAKQR